MAESDGGHVWPPRSSDLRIQEVTGGGPEASKPDDVFAALRALGHTGSLDDMWRKQLAAQGITDTGEKFEESIVTQGFGGAEWNDFTQGDGAGPPGQYRGVHAPENSGGTLIFLDNSFNIIRESIFDTAYDINDMSVGDTEPEWISNSGDVWIDSTGVRMIQSHVNGFIYATMSTPFDVTTMSADTSVSVTGAASSITGITASADGSKLFLARIQKTVWMYNVPTPFDWSTIDETAPTAILDVAAMTPGPFKFDTFMNGKIDFSSDGKLLALAGTASNIAIVRLATGFDISTASFEGEELRLVIDAAGIAWDREDDNRIYATQTSTNVIRQWRKGTAVDAADLTGGTANGKPVNNYYLTAEDAIAAGATQHGLAISRDGTKAYSSNSVTNLFYEYTLSTPFLWSSHSVENTKAEILTTHFDMAISDDGLKLVFVDQTNVNVWTMSVAYDLSTATVVIAAVAKPLAAQGVALNTDGTKMYFTTSSETILEYTLVTPYDLSTGSLTHTVPFVLDEPWTTSGNPICMDLDNNGRRLIANGAGRDVHEFYLSTAYDLSTAVWTGRRSGFENSINGLAYNKLDGNQFYGMETAIVQTFTNLADV